MTRFLHRPMFRTGGSAGQGITSGLTRPGYKRGRVVEPGGYEGTDDFFDIYKDLPDAWEKHKKHMGEYPKGTSDADFWLNFGTNILAQPGGRPILQTLGTAAKEPLARMQEQKTMERHGERKEKTDFLQTYIDAMSKLKGGEAGAQREANRMAAYEPYERLGYMGAGLGNILGGMQGQYQTTVSPNQSALQQAMGIIGTGIGAYKSFT